jgi:hypothetical protein
MVERDLYYSRIIIANHQETLLIFKVSGTGPERDLPRLSKGAREMEAIYGS